MKNESVGVLGDTPPVAVVGLNALFPGAATVAAFWRDILEGTCRLSEVPRTHWASGDYFDPRLGTPDKVPTTRGGFLPPIEFSPLEFGLPPSVAQATDTAQLLALVVAKRALMEATRGRFESIDRSRISVVLGVASATELVAHMSGRLQIPVAERAMRAAGLGESEIGRVRDVLAQCYVPWQENTFPGLLGNVVAGRIANRLDLGGTNMVVDAACASSLAAVDASINELALGRADLVLTGGVDTLNDILMFMCFAQTGALSPTGDCRPFSDDADGTMLGEGIGILALKRLADAERDGDAIYAVIHGVGTSSDGRANSIYAPAPSGQALALERAYARAGYGPQTVQLVEAHGTGTKAGDAAEIEALRDVFVRAGANPRGCALGSIKSQIGHTKAAAGAAGLIKAVLALHHKVLPGTAKVRAPHPSLHGEGHPFYLNTKTRPWIRGTSGPRRSSVSALGFGGTNFHVALEEYRGPGPRPSRVSAFPSELVLFSGVDAAELAERCGAMAHALGAVTDDLAAIAIRSQGEFDAKAPARLAIVAESLDDLREKSIGAAQTLLASRGVGVSTRRGIHFQTGPGVGPVAFLFPGQGSQYVGMGGDLAVHFACVREAWDRVADMPTGGEERLHEVVYPVPVFGEEAELTLEARLTETAWAQPAIAATSLAMLGLLERVGLSPICAGGHSLGEVTALGAFGAFERDATISVARRRGELVSDAAKVGGRLGAMTAVIADRSAVERLIVAHGLEVVVANHNAPEQVVVSGEVRAIEEAERRLADARLETRRLPVSTAFHSPLVAGACTPFRQFLERVGMASAPAIPIYGSRTAAIYPTDGSALRDELARAVAAPVLFVEQIEAMYAAGARVFVEVGPGAVLTRLVGRCLGARPHVAVELDARGKHGVTALWDAFARLSVAGVALDFARLRDAEVTTEQPGPKPTLTLRLTGANYGKPVLPDGSPRDTSPEIRESVPPLPTMPSMSEPSTPPHAVHGDVIAAHMEYQRLMAETHVAFLSAIAPSSGRSEVATPAFAVAGPEARISQSALAREEPVRPASSQVPAPAAITEPVEDLDKLMLAVVAETTAPPPVTSAPSLDLEALMLEVVAEKTGYPAEMIELGMDLESDLGIDSIKRVEILSTVRTRAPALPEVDTAEMARLRTLQQIVAFLGGGAESRDQATPTSASRHVVQAVVAEPSGLAVRGLFGPGEVVVTPDGGGIAAALVARLRARGANARIADPVPPDASAVVFLGGLRPVDGIDAALAVNREAFATARVVAPRFRESGGAFVTVQDTGGDFGLGGRSGDRAWLAGVGALAKTAAQEWSSATAKAIDIEVGGRDDEAVAEAIERELITGGPELEVGLGADGTRVAITTTPAPVGPGERSWVDRSVFVVSGGARGVTASALLELARACRPRLLLLGRTPLLDEPEAYRAVSGDASLKRTALAEAQRTGTPATPRSLERVVSMIAANREVRATLRALEDAGAQVRYAAVDVRDAAAIAALVAETRKEWGPIAGLVHGAGVLRDAFIAEKTDAQFDEVWGTKVLGLRALLEATRGDPLQWLVLFSSVAARTGNAGQSDYAMANEVLNKVAAREAHERGDACRVVSIGWGPWNGGMVTPALRSHFEARGVRMLEVDDGARAFVRELCVGGAVEIGIGGGDFEPGFHPTRRIEADVLVNERTWPQLASHRIKGQVVLPMAVVAEWFARLVRPFHRGAHPVQLRGLRVVRGVPLAHYFTAHGERFHVIAVPEADGRNLALELRDGQGQLRYAATYDGGPGPTEEPKPPLAHLAPGPWATADDLYGPTTLFHGEHFKVLRSLDGISPTGARATLSIPENGGWNGEWLCEPPVVDGALQLALLFGLHGGAGPSLPMGIERVVCRNRGAGLLRCELTERRRTPEGLHCDLAVTDAGGAPVVDLIGVQMFVVPSGTTAV